MIKTNGNRRPKALIKKTKISFESTQMIREVLFNDMILKNLKDRYRAYLTKEEISSILAEKQRKNGEVVTLIANNGKLFDMSLYVIEKEAIVSLKRGYDKRSDVVELKSGYFFKDNDVVNNMAHMYFLKGRVVVIQHPDEISSFENSEKDAIFISEVEMKEENKSVLNINIANVDYHSSSDYKKSLQVELEKKYIHLKVSKSKNAFSVNEKGVNKDFITRQYVAEESLDVPDGFYKAIVSDVKKAFVINTNAITGKKEFYLFDLQDDLLKDKVLLDYNK